MWKTKSQAFETVENDVRALRSGGRSLGLHFLVVSALVAGWAFAEAAHAQKTQAVEFVEGVTSAKMTGRLTGYETMTYTLEARAGQAARIVFKPDNGNCDFLIFRPGQTAGQNQAFFNSSNMGNDFSGILPSTGAYSVWVGLSRDAARGLQSCGYSIAFSVTGGEP